jgi:hypothetical protein
MPGERRSYVREFPDGVEYGEIETFWDDPREELAKDNLIRRNDSASLERAKNTFERFHSRKPDRGVYPFQSRRQGTFDMPPYVEFPDSIDLLGPASRVLYVSDKWQNVGNTTTYFHDHGSKRVNFYVPAGEIEGLEPAQLPFGWPEEVSLIGECFGFVVLDDYGEIDSDMTGKKNILVASPDGWVDRKRPNRVFLAVINLNGGGVEGIIAGGNLRITAHGIEG